MTKETFDRIASEYDSALPAHVVDHYLDKRVQFISSHCPPGSALDLGCGTGMLAARLAGLGYEVTGVDTSQGMLDVMRERVPGVAAVHASGTDLPVDDDRFDLALTVAALHHIADRDAVRKTLAEMVRVTRPGGRVLVWDHNPRNPYWRLIMARVPQDDGSERLVPAREIVGGLENAGAEVLMARPMSFVIDLTPAPLMKAAAGLERLVERTPGLRAICAHNVVLARP